ncbi:hypothetical protein D9M69_51540 [compost metagenome]
MSRTLCASVVLISSWRLTVCAFSCSHSWRNAAVMVPSVSVQAAKRWASREASSACSATAAFGASDAACTRRSISARVRLACAWVWAEMSRTLCASVVLISSWRLTVWAFSCSNSWRKPAVMVPSVSAQADRRCASCAASCVCSPACDSPTVRTSVAACSPNATAAAVRACWLSLASFSPVRSWRDSASRHASAALAAAVSRRVATPSSSPAERCSKVWAKPSRDVRRSAASASLAR